MFFQKNIYLLPICPSLLLKEQSKTKNMQCGIIFDPTYKRLNAIRQLQKHGLLEFVISTTYYKIIKIPFRTICIQFLVLFYRIMLSMTNSSFYSRYLNGCLTIWNSSTCNNITNHSSKHPSEISVIFQFITMMMTMMKIIIITSVNSEINFSTTLTII